MCYRRPFSTNCDNKNINTSGSDYDQESCTNRLGEQKSAHCDKVATYGNNNSKSNRCEGIAYDHYNNSRNRINITNLAHFKNSVHDSSFDTSMLKSSLCLSSELCSIQ